MQQKQVITCQSTPFLKPPRMRMTPTFYHHDIFTSRSHSQGRVRFTPTFASTPIDHPVEQSDSCPRTSRDPLCQPTIKSVYHNDSKRRTIAEFSPCYSFYQGQGMRKLDAKQQLMNDLREGRGTSRMRKAIDLMSDPIFGGYTWEMVPYDPKKYSQRYRSPERIQKQPEITSQSVNKTGQLNPEKTELPPSPPVANTISSKKEGVIRGKGGQKKSTQRHAKNMARLKSADAFRHK